MNKKHRDTMEELLFELYNINSIGIAVDSISSAYQIYK